MRMGLRSRTTRQLRERAAGQALVEGLRLERADGRPDDQVVAVDQGDRAAGEGDHALEPVEGRPQDGVEVALAGRGRGDLQDQGGGGQGPRAR